MFLLSIKCKRKIPFCHHHKKETFRYISDIHIYLEEKSQYSHWNPETGDWQENIYYDINKISKE